MSALSSTEVPKLFSRALGRQELLTGQPQSGSGSMAAMHLAGPRGLRSASRHRAALRGCRASRPPGTRGLRTPVQPGGGAALSFPQADFSRSGTDMSMGTLRVSSRQPTFRKMALYLVKKEAVQNTSVKAVVTDSLG